MRRSISLGVLSAAALVLALPVDAATSTVKARDDYFTPDFRVVVTGDTVSWTVEGTNGHTITSYPGSPYQFDSSPSTIDTCEASTEGGGGLLPGSPTPVTPDCLERGDTYERRFDQVGTIDYYCKIHGDPSRKPKASRHAADQPCGMCARIVVKTPASHRPATRNPAPATATPTSSEEPSGSPSAEPSPSEIDPSLSGNASDEPTGGSGAPRAVIATFAVLILTGLGYLVWRRYFQPT